MDARALVTCVAAALLSLATVAPQMGRPRSRPSLKQDLGFSPNSLNKVKGWVRSRCVQRGGVQGEVQGRTGGGTGRGTGGGTGGCTEGDTGRDAWTGTEEVHGGVQGRYRGCTGRYREMYRGGTGKVQGEVEGDVQGCV